MNNPDIIEQQPVLSIVVPALNEAGQIPQLAHFLSQRADPAIPRELLLVDGGSKDSTPEIARQFGFKVIRTEKGRARQMNHGAKLAKGKLIYFLHADSIPPPGFDTAMIHCTEKGYEAGCFRMGFDSPNRILRFFAWFTRFNFLLCRGGDQSLFVKKALFEELQGFDERYEIYEDCEFIGRLYRRTRFRVLPGQVITSARKYRQLGVLKLQFHFGIIHLLNFLGRNPAALQAYYQEHIAARLS